MMKSNIYWLKMLCLALAFMIAGCSDDDGNEVEPEEEIVLPDPTFSFGTDSDSTELDFELIGDPELRGDNAYVFNATDEDNGCGQIGGDYIKLDTLGAIWEKGFSIAAWVEFQEERYFERIVDLGNGWGEHGGMNISFSRLARSNSLALTSWIDTDSTTNREKGRLIARDVIVNNKMMHYAASISPSGEMKIYINGELAAEKADGHPVANVQRNKNYIGHSNWCQLDPDFKGVMKGIYLFNKPITSGEVKALYQKGSSTE
ncbi:hypothetical protein C900_00492 [Fulvivirga imtechensis AK7]|uniref:LamG-like jellyroll fold domain-containing protein n=1 Tax=Fulvivirga imtechensis AK7 TaxID=1237149 RepID=L8JW14_9BACT|nr:LamG-like jellyroll fold domain-containing protein [Fulvivirga imtechensis]ELR72990.1 hypothetical protein C900_00492 [Fulvivirga imtechensis AK7]